MHAYIHVYIYIGIHVCYIDMCVYFCLPSSVRRWTSPGIPFGCWRWMPQRVNPLASPRVFFGTWRKLTIRHWKGLDIDR